MNVTSAPLVIHPFLMRGPGEARDIEREGAGNLNGDSGRRSGERRATGRKRPARPMWALVGENLAVVSDPLAAEREVLQAKESNQPDQLKEAKAKRRRTWYFELVLILVGYGLYSWVRGLVKANLPQARHHAADVVRLEKWLHIYVEKPINHWVADQHWLVYICNYWYAIMHFLVTIAVGIWIYKSHPDWARQIRTAWYAMNVVALLGFRFFPLEPPRLYDPQSTDRYGFVDTVVKFHTWGSWGDHNVAKDANLYAAMPSMHIGWSLTCATAIVLLARRGWVRVLGALYPVATLFVIVGTANHYFLDAVGGAVAFGVGYLLTRLISRKPVLPTWNRTPATVEG
jgi:hypothetical protein